jgi:predicted metal-dependent phosphoesterase TrpH
MRVDLHSHSRFSPDARMGWPDIADACELAGIDVLATTDHHTAEGALTFQRWVDRHDRDLHVIAGEEIMTHQGEVVGLYLDETIESPCRLGEAVDAIRDQGGLVLLQHPFDPMRHGLDEAAWDIDPDIVEVFNARTRLDGANGDARSYAEERDLPAVACSDAHTVGEVGSAYAEVSAFDPSDPDALLEALEDARLVGDTSPVWVSVHSTLAKVLDKLGL